MDSSSTNSDDDGRPQDHLQNDDGDDELVEPYKPSGVNVRDFSCIPFADALWWCYTPGNQMKVYYRTGGVDTCLPAFRRLKKCLGIQMMAYSKPREAQKAYDTSDLNKYLYPRTSVSGGVWTLKETPALEPDVDSREEKRGNETKAPSSPSEQEGLG